MRFISILRCVKAVDSNIGMIMHGVTLFVQFCFDLGKEVPVLNNLGWFTGAFYFTKVAR
ncbi:MAG: hypothetical protein NTV50_01460 [Planctomycetota bacterium]|nr:hypothetical protein [Planctomycetota bacterium]